MLTGITVACKHCLSVCLSLSPEVLALVSGKLGSVLDDYDGDQVRVLYTDDHNQLPRARSEAVSSCGVCETEGISLVKFCGELPQNIRELFIPLDTGILLLPLAGVLVIPFVK